jgi:hypothetical protein
MSKTDPSESEYIDTNAGDPPSLLVLAWDKYGTPGCVLNELERLVSKQRRVPKIQFSDDNCMSANLVLDTESQVNETYRSMKAHSISTYLAGVTHASINWNLPHSNQFRRVTFAILSLCGDISFYGRVQKGKLQYL